ncbi:glycerol dehydrogenase [Variovorax sp. PDNC026]|uniref:glycerol dehydrogenase n=1 Tax=Variovorax sp. PDNC026 TaxID=2811425 RepID=UPI001963946C|nr:glycerol dehydrogenase [Variovorax sp. PDNC026]QRY31853.1 glycerol dehydrogenase [Variovorax sp. PDNC026]
MNRIASRVFMGPALYVQGPGVLGQLGRIASELGDRPLVLLDAGIAQRMRPALAQIHAGMPRQPPVVEFSGEITLPVLDGLGREAAVHTPDLVIGIGGGKTLDAAKGMARRLNCDMVSVPTIASTDAPASRGLVIYDAHHRLIAVEQMARNPACVLVDTAWIARAPAKFLAAGIGDALSKKFEVRACAAAGGFNKHGTPACATALAIADACYATLRAHGATAMQGFETGNHGAALEAVVEACVLMSSLAFENGGLSLAHAMVTGLTQTPGVAQRLHGEHVAYGVLLQLALQGEDDAGMRDLMAFLRSVGLPVSLGTLGLPDAGGQDLARIAAMNLTSPLIAHSALRLEPADVIAAMRRIEALAEARTGTL